MENNFRIMVVEDDAKLGRTIQLELQENGYETELAYDGISAEHMFSEKEYHLVILDINLPYKSGLILCNNFRQSNKDIPIIMLTALGELDNKVDAFSRGADDYIIKPFHFAELLARVKVFLKRMTIHESFETQFKIADLEINTIEKTTSRNNKPIILTAKEFALLELLARAKGRVVSKVEIAEKIWETAFDTGSNTIEVYINFLRNKIDKPFDKKLIQTRLGFGYFLKE
jgi:DNA-binding response OmpR family regulator